MKKICLLLSVFLCVLCISATATAATVGTPDFEVGAQGVYLYNVDTDTVIWERNADQQMYPASLTKIMTCILALENTPDLDNTMVVYPQYVEDYLYNYQRQNGAVSLGGMLSGEEFSMRALLYALMLPSANEAAMTIAHHLGGSQEGFSEIMNKRAKELGAVNTHFVNPNGLFDAQHVTTPKDMAILTQHAMTLPGFMEIASTVTYSSGPTNKHDNLVWNNTNQMMVEGNSYYYPYLKGVKTGTLPEAGRCFVSTATKDGFTYLLVLMNAPYMDESGKPLASNSAFQDAANLYEWVFRTFRRKSLVEKGKYIKEVPLRLSMDKDYLQLMTAERFTALVPNNIEASSVIYEFDVPESVDAPIEKGESIGSVTLILSGEKIGTVELLSAETVAASYPLVLLDKTKAVLRSFWFKFAVIFFILLVILYVVLMILRNKRRKRMGSYKPRRRI